MKLLWERFGQPRHGITAADYWQTLEEVAGESLEDLRTSYAEGTDDSWEALVEGMRTQGLALSQTRDTQGRIHIVLEPLTTYPA
jgi:predicted metalloprotease with PDZ domain